MDLSADFRLRDPEAYETWYGNPHSAVEMQAEAVYGLTEFYRDEIAQAPFGRRHRLQCGDGPVCFAPVDCGGVIDLDEIILDLKCAVSGAGRALKENSAACGIVRRLSRLCCWQHPSPFGRV